MDYKEFDNGVKGARLKLNTALVLMESAQDAMNIRALTMLLLV